MLRVAAALVVMVGCGPRIVAASAPPPDLALDIAPVDLGAHPAGEVPPVTVAIVDHSPTRTFLLPKPHRLAYERGTFYYEYESARPDGTWETRWRTYFMNDSRPAEDPQATFELAPGARVVLDSAGVPPLTFADDALGRLRARLVYDVDAEWKRREHAAAPVGKVVSNWIEIRQIPGPLEVQLEVIAPVVVGAALDLPHTLRVTVRNRSTADISILGPGENSGMGFDIERPNGGVWPKGDRPVMDVAPGAGTPLVLHPGDVVEVFGPHAALGDEPGTWTYPAAESFRLRANFYQPAKHRFNYSAWVTIRSVAETRVQSAP